MSKAFTIMTFNLRVAVPTDPYRWDERKHWAAQIIEEAQPDLIGTQEATVPMLHWLKDHFHETYEVYGVNRTRSEEAGEFSAIFVKRDRFSIRRNGSFMLSETPDVIGSLGWDAACERICSWVELAFNGETSSALRFYNTHLDHIGETARTEGLRLILQTIREQNLEKPLPVMLTGDFNDTPESGLLAVIDEFEPMTSCFDLMSEAEKQHSRTFHGYRGGTEGSPIDYILSSQGIEFASCAIVRDKVEQGYPSDHYPIVAHMEMKENEPAYSDADQAR